MFLWEWIFDCHSFHSRVAIPIPSPTVNITHFYTHPRITSRFPFRPTKVPEPQFSSIHFAIRTIMTCKMHKFHIHSNNSKHRV